MISHFKAIQIAESLEDTIRELVGPIESIQLQNKKEPGLMPDGLDLIAGELTMVVLVFTNADLKITDEETDLLNNFRRVICGDDAFALTSHDYFDMCRRFLHLHPNRRLSIDHKPYTVLYLERTKSIAFCLTDEEYAQAESAAMAAGGRYEQETKVFQNARSGVAA